MDNVARRNSQTMVSITTQQINFRRNGTRSKKSYVCVLLDNYCQSGRVWCDQLARCSLASVQLKLKVPLFNRIFFRHLRMNQPAILPANSKNPNFSHSICHDSNHVIITCYTCSDDFGRVRFEQSAKYERKSEIPAPTANATIAHYEYGTSSKIFLSFLSQQIASDESIKPISIR